ncbi:MAG: trypsin-like peptidase domain-containing protein [Gammaproteobacteria bacterium]|nr:trypsin-like peptidase domain-containing protein [Gammaproteobacteria bacterium]
MTVSRDSLILLRTIRILLYALIGLIILVFLMPRIHSLWITMSAEPRTVTARGELAASEKNSIEIFQQASPSVVFITTLSDHINFWTRDITRIPRGTGSGFIWDNHGHIVTNYHVIKNASEINVRLDDQRTFKALLVGASPTHDIAVLRIPVSMKSYKAIPIGSSHDLKVGQSMYAIGNPFGLDHTLTTGVISALSRSLNTEDGITIKDLIQTDAAINPGNSGGPLLDSAGRLVGINTAIYSPSGAYAGIGFAVPVDTVNRVVPQVIAHGKYQRPSIGISVDDRISALITEQMDVSGVMILTVERNSPAAIAGLRGTRRVGNTGLIPGDIIQHVGSHRVEDTESLLDALDQYAIGEHINVHFLRDGKHLKTTVTLK